MSTGREHKPVPQPIRWLSLAFSGALVLLAYACFELLDSRLGAFLLLVLASPIVTLNMVTFLMRLVVGQGRGRRDNG